MALPPGLQVLADTLPIEHGARLDLCDGVPVFRAPHDIVARVEELLLEQQARPLSQEEKRELDRYEGLDDFLSLVNRLVRNTFLAPDAVPPHASAA
jgi:hypothetical protein